MRHFIRSIVAALVVVVGIAHATAQEPRLHAMVLTDTSPWANWGRYQLSVQMDSSVMMSLFSTNVPERQLVLHREEIVDNASGDPAKIKQLIKSIGAGPNDSVVVYFSGHGGSDDRGQYLAFAGGRLYRDELRMLLQQKGARLNVILTDCCNQRADGESFGAPSMDMEPPAALTPLFRSLFFQPRGMVDINASSPGEAAFFAPWDDDPDSLPPGSLFTTEIDQYIYRYKQQATSWDHLLRSVSLNVHLAFRAGYPAGAVGGKGGQFQKDQNVYAYEYPGMPAKQGPRTGFVVRDQHNQGVLITSVNAGYPASQVYDLSARRYVSLQPGELIVQANNVPVRTVAEIVEIVKNSPQVMRLKIRNRGGDREVLMRLRY